MPAYRDSFDYRIEISSIYNICWGRFVVRGVIDAMQTFRRVL